MSRKEQHHTRQARAKHRDQARRQARRDKRTRRRFELGAAVAAVVLLCLSTTTTAHAMHDHAGASGYTAYSAPAPAATTTTTTPIIDYPLPAAACVETSAHPCGHRAGADTIAAACGDPTCGMRDDPKFCHGASPCYFCCCGCDGGCGTGDHDLEPAACVPDWSPGMPGRPCTK